MTQQQERLIRLKDVIELTGLSRSTIYLYMNQGKFPRSISLGARSIGFAESQIQDWIQSKIGGSNA